MSDPQKYHNTFTTYTLSEAETREGHKLNTLTVAVIHNLRTSIAEEKLALKVNPESINTFLQQEAYLAGQLEILNYILQCNEESQQYHHITTQE